MKIGYMPDSHRGPYNQPEPSAHEAARFCDQLLQEGIEAEGAGFDGIFLPERHHRTETMFPPPLVLLAAYAARTTRVDLGTFVLQPPYYNPMHLAEDVARLKEQAALYRETAATHGRRPFVVLMRDGWVAPTRAEAERVFGPLWVQEMLFYYRWKLLTPNDEFRSEADFTVEKLRKYLVMGSPKDVIEQIETWTNSVQADYLIVRFRLPMGPAREQVLECIQRFGAEVIPHVRNLR